MSSQPMPPYYPNLITTLPNLDVSSHIEYLEKLLPAGWGIKDSFSKLGLKTSEFREAVSGYWFSVLSREDTQFSLSHTNSVKIVSSGVDFQRWVSEWDSTMEGRIFPKDIWRSHDLEFVLVERKNQVLGGFLLNKTSCYIGLSNWFGELDLISSALREVISPTQRVVGYASDREIDELSSFGFDPLQAMKVWIYK